MDVSELQMSSGQLESRVPLNEMVIPSRSSPVFLGTSNKPAASRSAGGITIIRLPQFSAPADPPPGANRIQPLRLKMVRSGSAGTPSSNVSVNGNTTTTTVPCRIFPLNSSPSLDLRKVADEEPVCLSGGSSPSPPIPPDSHLNQPLQINSIKRQYYWTVFGEYVKVNEEDSMALYGSDPTRPPRLVTDEMKRVYLEKKGRWPVHRTLSPTPDGKPALSSRLDKPSPKEKPVQKKRLSKEKPPVVTSKPMKKILARKCASSVLNPGGCKSRRFEKCCWVQVVNEKILSGHKEIFQNITVEKIAAFSVEQVVAFISSLKILTSTEIDCFKKQKIDGEALILLQQEDLIGLLNLKLGTSLKLMNFLLALKHN